MYVERSSQGAKVKCYADDSQQCRMEGKAGAVDMTPLLYTSHAGDA